MSRTQDSQGRTSPPVIAGTLALIALLALIPGVWAWPDARSAFTTVGAQVLGLLAAGVLLFATALLLGAALRCATRRERHRR